MIRSEQRGRRVGAHGMAKRKLEGTGTRVDALFRQQLSGFVEARNALASALGKEGHAEESLRVKALARPPAGAWALNQVYWHDRGTFDRMLRAGDALRRVQQQMSAGRAADARDAMSARQSAVQDVVERAMSFLRDSGQVVSPATRQRLVTTADAMAAYGSDTRGYMPGRLTSDLEAPGFAALATLGTPSLRLVGGGREADARGSLRAAAPAAPVTDREAERHAERERDATVKRRSAERARALRAADRALRDASRELASARQHAVRAHAAVEGLTREHEVLEEQLARVVTRRRAAEAAAAAADESLSGAERTRRDAEAAVTRARDAAPGGA